MGRELRGPVQARLLFTGNISKVVTTSFEVLPVTGRSLGHHPWASSRTSRRVKFGIPARDDGTIELVLGRYD